jgi:hypothetical protein
MRPFDGRCLIKIDHFFGKALTFSSAGYRLLDDLLRSLIGTLCVTEIVEGGCLIGHYE